MEKRIETVKEMFSDIEVVVTELRCLMQDGVFVKSELEVIGQIRAYEKVLQKLEKILDGEGYDYEW